MAKTSTSSNSVSRRNFIAGAAAALPGAMLAQAIGQTAPATDAFDSEPTTQPRKYPLGLELYSVRGQLVRSLPNTLRTVASIGYEFVEFYAPYYEWTIPYAKRVKTLMDDLGLRCYSTHNRLAAFTPGEPMAKAIELNQILGSRMLVLASAPGTVRGAEGWKQLCGQLTAAVETLEPHGLTAGFHNHQTEWRKIDGDQRIMDIIAANTPKEFVLQLDVGTAMEAGADPVAWIKANPGRIKAVHLKDWAPGTRQEEKGYRVLFGEGVSPWKEITATAEAVGGVEYYIMEQEGSRFSEFETAQKCFDAWKAFRAQG